MSAAPSPPRELPVPRTHVPFLSLSSITCSRALTSDTPTPSTPPPPRRAPQNEAIDRRERLRRLAMETIDLAKDPYFMRNHLGR
jgi:hypothetical protein